MTKPTFVKFPSIEQYRNVVKNVKDRARYAGKDENGNVIYKDDVVYPTIKFMSTVKLHGMNASVLLTDSGEFGVQSRNNMLSLTKDAGGFFAWSNEPKRLKFFKDIITNLKNVLPELKTAKQINIFGEFAGEGIQKGVALSKLPKSFYAFAIAYLDENDETKWLPIKMVSGIRSGELGIFNVLMFEHEIIEIDFNNPDEYINRLVEKATAIGDECPVGKYFGVEKEVGEGIVLTSIDCDRYTFKVKDDRHSVSKVKTLSKVDEVAIANAKEFVEATVTPARLEQGIDYLKEMNLSVDEKSTGVFIKWVVDDVIKEESDIILAKQLDFKKVKSQIGQIARQFYMQRINTNL